MCPEATIPELLGARLSRTPGASAIENDDQMLTNRQLAARVHQLAGWLKTHGAQPETIIAVALPRSAELVTPLLASTESGATYRPVDPDHPSRRSGYLRTDAIPRLTIIRTTAAATLPITHSILDRR